MTKHLARGIDRFRVSTHRPASITRLTKTTSGRPTAARLIVKQTARAIATRPITRLDRKLRESVTRFR
jgi:hypothetical protein